MSAKNPQVVAIADWESPTLTVTMTANGSIAGQTFQLNVRDQSGAVKLQLTPASITTAGGVSTPGAFAFTLTSAQVGAMGAGSYKYDIWRTDGGFEKRLVYGPLVVDSQRWKSNTPP